MKPSGCVSRIALTLAALAAVLPATGTAHAQSKSYWILYDFGQGKSDGWSPAALTAVAKNGDLYGVTVAGGTYNWGTVFKITAPKTRGGIWTESILYDFPSDNQEFPTSLVIDKDGTLYGAGGGPNTRGFIFRLTPPGPGQDNWKYAVLYTFESSDKGSAIQSNLVLDDEGNLCGATEQGGDVGCEQDGCGTVFELKRPTKNGGKWRLIVLYTFTGSATGEEPFAGVTLDQKGNVYGTTNYGGTFGHGVAYSLTPPAKKGQPWIETVLYSFDPISNVGSNPESPVIFDGAGNVYGTTAFGGDLNCSGGFGCGVVYELSPPAKKGKSWSYATLYAFQGGSDDGAIPLGSIVFDSVGNLYGTTEAGGQTNGGTAYRLSPPGSGGTWTETVLHAFQGINGNNIVPEGLIWGKWNDLYGVTELGGVGGCQSGCGTAFEIRP